MSIWYKSLRWLVAWVLNRYFHQIEIKGLDNIPHTGAVLFTVNHQNAFLDALLIVTSSPRLIHFLARADVFRSSYMKAFFKSLNMMPIYRWRDGRNALAHNHDIFEQCYQLLNKEEALLLFPEANHHQNRRLLPLSKGFTRISSGVDQESHPLKIVPVGLNYSHHRNFGGSVSIYFGTPIIPPSINLESRVYVDRLRLQVTQSMRKLITHIPETADYQLLESNLNQKPWHYLDPDSCNSWIKATSEEQMEVKDPPVTPVLRKVSLALSYICNLIPLFLCQALLQKINDPVFSSSIKVLWGLIVFPLYYLVLGLVVGWWLGVYWVAGVLGVSILTMVIRKWSLRIGQ